MKPNFKYIFVFLFLALTMSFVSAHTININFYDENSLNAIPTVTITDSNGSSYTSDVNGLWSVDLVGAKSFDISKTGYDSRPLEFYFTADANYNFLLNPTGLDSNIGFIVKDSNNNLWTNKYLMFQQSELDAWDINSAIYLNKTFDNSSQESSSYSLVLSTDGTKGYTVGTSNDTMYQYTLSTAWDISTATYANKNKSVSAQDSAPIKMRLSIDGTKAYILGGANNRIFQYTLSTAWDISTATYANKFIASNSQEGSPDGFVFNYDGTKMYIVGQSNDTIYQYTLSTAWDISTATYANKNKSVSDKFTVPYDLGFSNDGLNVFVVGNSVKYVIKYTLSTAWDISTANYDVIYNFSTPNSSLGFSIKSDDGEYFYLGSNDTTYQFQMDTYRPNSVINSILTSSSGEATASLLANGDYNALLYTADGYLTDTYEKTTVTVNKPKNEITLSAVSPYDITVGGLLGYSLTNQTASSVSFNIFAGTQGFYYFSVVDYNAVVADRKYIPRQYFVQVPMGSGYYSAITYQPYLLSEIDAVVPKITVLDQFNKPIGEVDVFISRYINNVLTIVESGKTTNTGTLSFSAYPLEYYYINVLYNDVDKGTYRIQPRESADNFIIVIDTTSTEFITDLLVIDANFAGTAKTVNIDDSNITADVTITQNLNQATSYNLYLMQGNTVKASTTGIISGLTTNISYEFDCSVLDKFNSNIVLKLVVNYPDGNQTFYYTITATKNQNGLLYFAPRVINDIGQPLGIILAILITGIILAGLTFSGLNIGSTAIAIMGVLILSVFMFLGWLDVGVKVLGFDIARFFFVLMAFAIVYLVMRGEQYA